MKITSSDKKATKTTTPTTGRKRKKSTTLLNRDDQDDDDFETVTTNKKEAPSKSPGTKKPKKLPEGFQLHGRDEFVGKRTRRFFNGKPTDGTITCWSPKIKMKEMKKYIGTKWTMAIWRIYLLMMQRPL